MLSQSAGTAFTILKKFVYKVVSNYYNVYLHTFHMSER